MSQPVQGVQPSVLQWARESAGLSHEDVASKLKRAPSDIHDWDSGTSAAKVVA
jgi:ribosome-binding protein aMBF1 (putative translation factor)